MVHEGMTKQDRLDYKFAGLVNKSMETTNMKQSLNETDPLSSWNEGATKESIIRFIKRVTDKDGSDYVPPMDRIAVFDNDGTLWSEQPLYFQLGFAIDVAKALVGEHPEWEDKPSLRAAVEDDIDAILESGTKAMIEILVATHGGDTTEEFERTVRDWIGHARHPDTGRLFTEMVFQPMLELLDYLRANEVRTYIVSGGGIEFMRVWVEDIYGIPPEQVIGSSIKVEFELRESGPVLVRIPEVDFLDDVEGKPVAIHKFIGRRPILAFGNSDGDLPMLQWTAAGEGLRFMGLVHHTDDEREWKYDRESPVGRLDKALDEVINQDWTVVDMKRDWVNIYPTSKE